MQNIKNDMHTHAKPQKSCTKKLKIWKYSYLPNKTGKISNKSNRNMIISKIYNKTMKNDKKKYIKHKTNT